jgi:rod shape-determining protein MreC
MRYVGYEQLNLARQRASAPRRRRFNMIVPGLIFVSVALLVLSRMEHSYVSSMRWRITELVTPVLSAALIPLEPLRWAGRNVTDVFVRVDELQRLRDENQQLQGWQWRANELERKFADLSATSKTVRETAIEFTTARVIANSSGAFVRSAMINAGRDNKVKTGYPVMSGDGLVGRVVETGPSAARVLLLTDVNSRIPVFVGPNAIRAMLAGDNGAAPKLIYVAPDSEVKVGDEVSASGVGGLFPRGLRIGAVVSTSVPLRVKPHASLDALEYLSILFYDSPALEMMGGDTGLNGAAVLPPGRASSRTGQQ